MTKKITLQLRDEVIARALEVAGRSHRDLEAVLEEWLQDYVDDLPIEQLSDREILSLCKFELNPMYQHELRYLLYHHQQDTLTVTQGTRLDQLLRVYRKGLVRRARAHQVALARGLQDQPMP